ncbi:MAG: hypothetical protein ABJN84_05315 [Flavobacteriaceae bacterium]
MLDKKIYRYTDVELLDVIRNAKDSLLVKKAESELKKRNLTELQLQNLESEYLKYKDYQEKRKDEPLTREEWLTFFFLPFSSSPYGRKISDSVTELEQQRFVKFGFEKKIKEAAEVRTWAYIFWFVLMLVIGVIIRYFNIRF